jgi:hypothetical protein
MGGEAVATKMSEVKNRGREGRSINKHVREWMSDRHGESVQHVTVYDAMRQLGELPRYEYEERGDGQTRYYLWKAEGEE